MSEDSINVAGMKTSQKFDQLVTFIKEQGQKFDHTIDSHKKYDW